MDPLIAVTAGYLVAMAVPWLHRRFRVGRVLFLLPLALTIYFATLLPGVLGGSPVTAAYSWVPSLGVTLSFYIDALSLIFALLISGIGTLVFLYSSNYLQKHPYQGRFFVYMLVFMSSMLGVVTASNIVSLFIFWELTSVSSYLLIGLNHDQERSRYAALQALLVTGIGGLALLAGLILLGQASGSLELTAILTQPDVLQGNTLYMPILILVLAGAFTKSAQFPFHFWLANATAFGHHGQGGYLSAGASDPGAGRHGRLVIYSNRLRNRNHAGRRLDGHTTDRLETSAGILHDKRAGHDYHAAGIRQRYGR